MDSLLGKYGLETTSKRDVDYCSKNKLLRPKLIRYQGMGCYEIFAEATTNSKKYFIIQAGGPNGYEVEDNYQRMLSLTLEDTVSFNDVMDHLKQSGWTEIVNITEGDGVDIHTVVEH